MKRSISTSTLQKFIIDCISVWGRTQIHNTNTTDIQISLKSFTYLAPISSQSEKDDPHQPTTVRHFEGVRERHTDRLLSKILNSI